MDFETYNKMISDIQQRIDIAIPAIVKISQEFSKNQELINKALLPMKSVTEQYDKLAATIVNPAYSQMAEIAKTIQCDIYPKIYDFQIASSYINAVDKVAFTIPKVLDSYQAAAESVIRSTEVLKNVYSSIQKIPYAQMIYSTQIENKVINPSKELFSQLTSVKDLGFYKINIKPIEDTGRKIVEKDSDDTTELISSINPDFVSLLSGAEESLLSKNSDKIRHSITSLRELLTQIMHILSPDNEIVRIYSDKKYYDDKGKPTRRTRLMYIFKNHDGNDYLVDFYDADINAILCLFDLYQKGTHEVKSSMNDDQLKYIISRTKNLICYLLSCR